MNQMLLLGEATGLAFSAGTVAKAALDAIGLSADGLPGRGKIPVSGAPIAMFWSPKHGVVLEADLDGAR
jgi:hypothetical protein